MEIKKRAETRRRIDIHEWNDTAEAYVGSLGVLDRIAFYDQLRDYSNRELSADKRAEAGITICVLTLTDREGNPLLTIEDMDAIKEAAFEPIGRVISALLESEKTEGETEEEAAEKK